MAILSTQWYGGKPWHIIRIAPGFHGLLINLRELRLHHDLTRHRRSPVTIPTPRSLLPTKINRACYAHDKQPVMRNEFGVGWISNGCIWMPSASDHTDPSLTHPFGFAHEFAGHVSPQYLTTMVQATHLWACRFRRMPRYQSENAFHHISLGFFFIASTGCG